MTENATVINCDLIILSVTLSSMFCCTRTKILLTFVFSWLTRMQVAFSGMINTKIRKLMDRRDTYFFVLFLKFFFYKHWSSNIALLQKQWLVSHPVVLPVPESDSSYPLKGLWEIDKAKRRGVYSTVPYIKAIHFPCESDTGVILSKHLHFGNPNSFICIYFQI